MKFNILVGVLHKSLENVQGVVDKRNITPILSNIRISAQEDNIILNATDMDLDIVEILNAKIEQSGATTVSAHMMFETIKRLPSDANVEISLVDEQLHLKCGAFKAKFNCLSVEDFPVIQTNDLPNNFNVSVLDFKKIIEKTRFAISMDETRYYLNGIYIHTTENASGKKVLRGVSTDGHRLAMAETSVENNINIDNGLILPKKAVDELYKLLDKLSEQELNIACSNTKISFKFGDKLILTSKLIDGNFPNYNKVIPISNDKNLEVNKKAFVDAVNLISVFSDDKLKAVKIHTFGNKIKLTAHKTDNEGEQELDVVNSIDEMEICFNAKYLNDICALIHSENLLIKLSTSSTPAIIKNTDSEDCLFVIMPMRL
jgi:DNA polymerase-3 subunit beta